jgi:hypothetical protein
MLLMLRPQQQMAGTAPPSLLPLTAAPPCPAPPQAVVVSGGSPMWEKGSNQKVDLQGSKDVSLFHVFKA